MLQICIFKVTFLVLYENSAWSSCCYWWLNMELAQFVSTSRSPQGVITLGLEVGGNVPYSKQTNWNLLYFLYMIIGKFWTWYAWRLEHNISSDRNDRQYLSLSWRLSSNCTRGGICFPSPLFVLAHRQLTHQSGSIWCICACITHCWSEVVVLVQSFWQ